MPVKEYTLKEIQKTCDRIGARLRFLPTEPSASYLTGDRELYQWSLVLSFREPRVEPNGALVRVKIGAHGSTMDEAWERALDIARREELA